MSKIVRVPISNPVTDFIVDEADLPLVAGKRWSVTRDRHVTTWHDGKAVGVHRLIMNIVDNKELVVDHINGDPLDNRRANLRTCTHAENLCNQKKSKNNTSGFKGVYITKTKEGKPRFSVMISKNKRLKYLGVYDGLIEAALAYDKAARELHGEFAQLNFPKKAA